VIILNMLNIATVRLNPHYAKNESKTIMIKSESIANLAAALCKAQSELSNPKKTSANPFFKSRYADLSEVINASKPILAEHGLSVIQLLTFTDCVHVETILLHSTGEYISETLSMPVPKQDAQTIGAVATYSRRYSWAAICGLAQEDDDGNTATGKTASQVAPYKAQPKPTEPKQDIVDYGALLSGANSLDDLVKSWALIPKARQAEFVDLKNEVKEKLLKPRDNFND